MTAQLEADPDTEVFTTLVDASLTDDDAGQSGGWSTETRLHMLAYEIATYRRDLALRLAEAGKRKMSACA